MTTQTQDDRDQVVYPDHDGEPMSDNTLQFRWIVTLQGNLDIICAPDPNVFVAGDLLWYAVEGQPTIRAAPDTLVAFGRPKGYRGSYRQWQEGGIAPQVVFEVLSPGNRPEEMARKFQFYDRYGVEEYYLYDPDTNDLQGWRRQEGSLRPLSAMHGWVSPRLGIRFDLSSEELAIFRPDGTPFLTVLELEERRLAAQADAAQARQQARQALREAEQARQQTEESRRQIEEAQRQAEQAQRQAEQARQQAEESRRVFEEARQEAEQAQQQAEQARQQTEQERQAKERLAAQLRALGIEPEA